MIKIVKNPKLAMFQGTELENCKYLFATNIGNKTAYAKIGLKPLFGYVVCRIKYRNK